MTRSLSPTPAGHYSLWLLTIAPGLWGLHLLGCYITAAVWCAKSPPGSALNGVRSAIAWYTILALAGIGGMAWVGFRRHRHGTAATTDDLDSAEDRHRFLGFATLLLSGLSALGVVYAAFAASYFETCQ